MSYTLYTCYYKKDLIYKISPSSYCYNKYNYAIICYKIEALTIKQWDCLKHKKEMIKIKKEKALACLLCLS